MVFYNPSHQNRWPPQKQDRWEAGYQYDYMRDRRINADFYGHDLDHILPRFARRARGMDTRTTAGPYEGYGPITGQPSDERIREEVCDRLTQHGWLDARSIQVEVEDGEVILRGRVDGKPASRMAEDTAFSVGGVRDVRNELKTR